LTRVLVLSVSGLVCGMDGGGAHQRATDGQGGLTLMGVRLHNPVTGLFLSTDPVYGGNPNTYSYPVNPITGYDLEGRRGLRPHPATGSQKNRLPLHKGPFHFKPETKWHGRPLKRRQGFRDQKGRKWTWDPSGHAGGHWDVQVPGSHINADPDGPRLPSSSIGLSGRRMLSQGQQG